MNELKEAITEIISQGGYVDNLEVDVDYEVEKIMQLIETYTAKRELEARKQDIKKLDGMLEFKERYGEPKDYADSEWNEAIHYAITQLSSQLTNNKEEV